MRFSSIVGCTSFKNYLTSGIDVSKGMPTLLFASPKGGRGLPLALAFITYAHCRNRGAEEACGVCSSCQKMKELTHPDFHFLFPMKTAQMKKGGGGDGSIFVVA